MFDQMVRIHLQRHNLLVVAVVATEAAKKARAIHDFSPYGGQFFAKGLAAGFGIAGLLGGESRINLQITCNGPVGGLFVDCDSQGRGRGYLKNPRVTFLEHQGVAFEGNVFGSQGMLTVVRELSPGQFYQGTVDLEHFDLAGDLEINYLRSEQIETAVRLQVISSEDDYLEQVIGIFIQAMPGCAANTVSEACLVIDSILNNHPPVPKRALDWIRPLTDAPGNDWDILSQCPVCWECRCSMESVFKAVLSLGRQEIQNMLDTTGEAAVSCSICRKTYSVSEDILRQMLQSILSESSKIE